MLAEISAAIQSAKVLGELLTATKNLTNYNEFVSAVYEINTKLMGATSVALASQEKQSLLSNRVTELENRLAELENWEHEMKGYRLFEFQTGAIAYISQFYMETGEPLHYLCATCVGKRQKSILQPIKEKRYLRCFPCGNDIMVIHSQHPSLSTNVEF